MKKFLLLMFGLLLGAVITIVLFFVWLHFYYFNANGSSIIATNEGVIEDVGVEQLPAGDVPNDGDSSSSLPPYGVPLRNLPLSDGQKSVINAVGIDVETFIITPDMQTCAREKLGEARTAEIIAGSAPSVIETTKLLPCLKVQ